jgi:diguanylate cyclase (GGDEF)-like protein
LPDAGGIQPFWKRTEDFAPLWLTLLAGIAALLLAWLLRELPAPQDGILYGQMEFASGLLALIFAAAVLARFRGTYDRHSLIFAVGFAVNGIILVGLTLGFSQAAFRDSGLPLRDPTTWVFSRTLLALLFLVPLSIERSLLVARHPNAEIGIAVAAVVALTALLSSVHSVLPIEMVVYPRGILPRPGNLVPGALFVLATVGYWRRLDGENRFFDQSVAVAAALNFLCCTAAAESVNVLDVPFLFGAILQFSSYAVLLGGALFDNVRLFDRIRRMAGTDPLTGLANYRGMMESLEAERARSERTGRVFAVVLLDLDGLKAINDRYGHLAGSRAICRVAAVLRRESRAVDVAARYGGDEFALVLPETSVAAAHDAARRVCLRVSRDRKSPPISVSAGVAAFPGDGMTIEALLLAADRALYAAKASRALEPHVAHSAEKAQP